MFDAVMRMGKADNFLASVTWVRDALKLGAAKSGEPVSFVAGSGESPIESPAGQPEQKPGEGQGNNQHALADGPPTPAEVTHPKFGKPSRIDCYTVGIKVYEARVRYDTSDGKAVLPWHHTGKQWMLGAAPQPRPLYRLGELQISPGVPVLVVEGERPWTARLIASSIT